MSQRRGKSKKPRKLISNEYEGEKWYKLEPDEGMNREEGWVLAKYIEIENDEEDFEAS